MPGRLTFGEVVERGGVRDHASRVTRDVIRRSNEAAAEDARVHLYVLSCDTCAATKACCGYVVTAYLYEAIPVAARLVRERRDTPALRKRLRDAAARMEAVGAGHVGPCVFLDAAERCTIHDDRPAVCGTHLVSSPAERCARPGGEVTAIAAPLLETVPPATAVAIAEELGLAPIGTQYFGMLPRMVLLCLEAWARPDYVRFLATHGRAAAERIAQLLERDRA
ncbi:MAG: YkgJ family cysteine cluster protein [Deltaproteobacteria bacterium]|nr:YkgJ family cysteine cluster protein [Kofleriaceae bacterium]